ncbi:MAG: ATP-dependent sacrificial sulfur transferase LarE [Armatimonadetes bacterium]|jgi:uncharacterized protein|nr:ATP-dependent sacrificial sulfur transferase LarE [Armatimonadota bacterium]
MNEYQQLVDMIAAMEGVVVGYSGGVDSALVAKAATDALGERAVCVLIDSFLIPKSEIDDAVLIAQQLGLHLERIKMDALAIEKLVANDPDRCYHCKIAVFSIMREVADSLGFKHVLDGTNADDESDFRPGAKAVEELRVRSPLKELGLTKERVREISRELGLPTWDKPSYACLASRVPYGTRLTLEILGQVEAAECILHELGFTQCRVRHHGNVARIELMPEDMHAILATESRNLVLHRFRALGYGYITLDLAGFRTGSMNEPLVGNHNFKEWGIGNR